MILLGVCLILFFLAAGFQAAFRGEKKPVKKYRGPVRDPFKSGFMWRYRPDCATLLASLTDQSGCERQAMIALALVGSPVARPREEMGTAARQ